MDVFKLTSNFSLFGEQLKNEVN